jgi:hypothetical protein
MATTMATGAAAHTTDACRSSGAPNIQEGARTGFRYWMAGCYLGFLAMRDYRMHVHPHQGVDMVRQLLVPHFHFLQIPKLRYLPFSL